MPGRVLGGSPRKQRNALSSPPKPSRLPPTAEPEASRHIDKASVSWLDQNETGSPKGLAAAEVGREVTDERRAWAQRAGAGRPPRSTSMGFPTCSAGAVEGGRTFNLVGRSSNHAARGRGDGEGVRRDRALSADHEAVETGGTKKSESEQDDPVSRAFRRYASDRRRERGGRRPLSASAATGVNPPLSSPLTTRRRRTALLSPERKTRTETKTDEQGVKPFRRRQEERQPPRRRLSSSESLGTQFFAEEETEDHLGCSSEEDGRIGSRYLPQHRRYGRGSDSAGITSGDESGGRVRAIGSRKQDTMWQQPARGYVAGLDESEGHDEEQARGGLGRTKEQSGAAGRQRALRQVFDMYDINGDGFITYLEVSTPPMPPYI